MNTTQNKTIVFMELFAERIVAQTERAFLFEGVYVESEDVASSRGLLPMILHIVRIQATAGKAVLSDDDYRFLYGWLDTLEAVNDPHTITGKRVECRTEPDADVCRYTIGAALVVAIDFMISCSNIPKTIHFDMFKEEFLYADNDGMQPA